MSRRSSYPPGRPSWVAQLSPDPEAARRFYGAVLGWQFTDIAGEGGPPFYIADVEGDPVASLAGPDETGTWIMAVTVRDLDEAHRAAEDAGCTAPGESVDIATLGRFHRLHDPEGAEVHVVEVLADRGPMRVSEAGAWTAATLTGPDPGASSPFYEALFGWQEETWSGGHGDVSVAKQRTEGRPLWVPRFAVRDLEATLDVVEQEGGRVRGLDLTDPFGARFQLIAAG